MSTHSYVIENNADLKVGRKAREAWQREAQRYVDEFLLSAFGITKSIKVTVTNRLTRTHGYFRYSQSWDTGEVTPIEIKIAGRLCKAYEYVDEEHERKVVDFIEGVLRHEATHYALCLQGEDHRDGDIPFESALVATDTLPSGGTPETRRRAYVGTRLSCYYVGECNKCHKQTKTTTVNGWLCNYCYKKGVNGTVKGNSVGVTLAEKCVIKGRELPPSKTVLPTYKAPEPLNIQIGGR